jgi:hypothetical protein
VRVGAADAFGGADDLAAGDGQFASAFELNGPAAHERPDANLWSLQVLHDSNGSAEAGGGRADVGAAAGVIGRLQRLRRELGMPHHQRRVAVVLFEFSRVDLCSRRARGGTRTVHDQASTFASNWPVIRWVRALPVGGRPASHLARPVARGLANLRSACRSGRHRWRLGQRPGSRRRPRVQIAAVIGTMRTLDARERDTKDATTAIVCEYVLTFAIDVPGEGWFGLAFERSKRPTMLLSRRRRDCPIPINIDPTLFRWDIPCSICRCRSRGMSSSRPLALVGIWLAVRWAVKRATPR